MDSPGVGLEVQKPMPVRIVKLRSFLIAAVIAAISVLFSGCDTQMTPVARPAVGLEALTNAPKPVVVTPPPSPSTLFQPIEIPIRAAAKPEVAEPGISAPSQADAQPPTTTVAPIAPKQPTAPAKAAPPHFIPRPVTNELAITPPPRIVATQRPPVTIQIAATPVNRPKSVARALDRELGPANFVWFGAGLGLVGLVSFGYPALRGRLNISVAGLMKGGPGRSLPKHTEARIRLDTNAVRQAMATVEPQSEGPVSTSAIETPANEPVADCPATDSGNSPTEPLADPTKVHDAPASLDSAADPKLPQPPVDSMKVSRPKPRAPQKEETAEEKERRLEALKELLKVPPSKTAAPEPAKTGTTSPEISASPPDNDSRESSSTAAPSAS